MAEPSHPIPTIQQHKIRALPNEFTRLTTTFDATKLKIFLLATVNG